MSSEELSIEELSAEEIQEAEFTAIAALTRARFYDFVCEFWETIEPGVVLVLNWHIEYICDQLQEVFEAWERGEAQPDVLLNQPPGTSKSTIVTQLFPVWCWVRCPSFRIISSSYASDLSMSHSVKSRDCMRSDKFNRVFPGLIDFKADEDGKKAYRNTSNGQRFAASTGGRVTGMHGDCIIIDDPIDPENATGEKTRLKAAGHLRKLSTRKTDKSRTFTILLMQRVHELDPSGIWLKSGAELRHICLPAELTFDAATGRWGEQVRPYWLATKYIDKLLDPVRMGRAALAKLLLALGPYGYAGQMLQNTSPEGGGKIKKKWFTFISWPDFLKLPGAKLAIWNADVDTAYTEKQTNDPTAALFSCSLNNNLYIRKAVELRLEMPELIVELPRLCAANEFNQLSKIYIEPKASGLSTMQLLKRSTRLNVIAAPAPVSDKTSRVNVAAPYIAGGRVYIIEGSGGEQLIEQASTFPNAPHDDLLDCLTQAIARETKPKGGTSV